MATQFKFIVLALLLLVAVPPSQAQRQPLPGKTISRIAFGSCANQDKKQPILRRVVQAKPDLFIYLGDNIYGDTRDMARLQSKYDKLGARPEFQKLCKAMPVIATWDDHDYGENDAGRHYPYKAESKDIFLHFWKEPLLSPRRNHPGIYHALYLGQAGRRVQVILLDTRTFRDDLQRNNARRWKNAYRPHEAADSTLLGDRQWAWLAEQLEKPADVRIIASSNQFSHTYNGWESWNLLPREQEKMLALIREKKANGVIFISGDVHWGELSRMENPGGYPIYDLTSSGITQSWHDIEANDNRIGEANRKNNFGMIEIDWKEDDPKIKFLLHNKKGKQILSHSIRLSELKQ